MSTPSATELATVRDGAVLANAMPYIEDRLAKMKESVQKQALEAIRTKSITPELALQYWQEYAAIDRLLRQLKSEVSIAESAGHRVAPAMNR